MPAVPVHEVGRRIAPRHVLAWNPEPPVPHRASGVDNSVITGHQVGSGYVIAKVNGADEPDALVLKHPAQVISDRLDRLVIRRDAVPDQPIWRGQPVKDVDLDRLRRIERGTLLHQRLSGIQAGRARAYDGDVEGFHGRDSAPSWLVAGTDLPATAPGYVQATQ